ncbi:MAG: hypothetical protein ACQESN_11820 [Thermotogota bacterium]
MKDDNNLSLTSEFKSLLILACLIVLNNSFAFSQWDKCGGKYGNLSVKEFREIGNKLFASTNKGIITSNDGVIWDELIAFSFPINELYNYDNIIFGVFGYNALKVVFSKDLGSSWEQLNTDTLENYTQNIYSLLYDHGSILLSTGKGIFKTDDWGKNWILLTTKIIGNETIHSDLVNINNKYFAKDKNKNIYYSNDFGKNWNSSNIENINSRHIYTYNNNLFGVKDDKFIYKLNNNFKWELFLDQEFGFVSVVKPLCCKGVFISSDKNRIVFNKKNVIELPKIPIPNKYDLLQDVIITEKYIIVSVIDYGVWYIPYFFNVKL